MPSKLIQFLVYSQHIDPMEEAFRVKWGRAPLGMTRTRWINDAIGEKLDRTGDVPAVQPESSEEMEDSPLQKVFPVLCHVAHDLMKPLRLAVAEHGGSRNQWINDAIRMRLGLPVKCTTVEAEPAGLRMSLSIYPRNCVRIDGILRASGKTRTKWINEAIQEKYTRDLAAGSEAPVEKVRVPKWGPYRKLPDPVVEPEKPEQGEQLEGVPVAKLAEDEELSAFDWG